MGATGSVVRPEINLHLSAANREKFKRLQMDCNDRGMSSLETYLYLTSRYEDMLLSEKQIELASFEGSKNGGKGTNSNTTAKCLADSPNLVDYFKEKARIEQEILSNDINDVLVDMDAKPTPVHSPKVTNVVKHLFHVEELTNDQLLIQNAQNGLDANGKPVISSTRASMTAAARRRRSSTWDGIEQMQSAIKTGKKIMGLQHRKVFDCPICKIQFDSQVLLETHVSHSNIHINNIQIRERKMREAFEEAERLTNLAKNAITKFSGGIHKKESAEEAENTEDAEKVNPTSNVAKTRWQKAVDKVIADRLRAQFMPIVDQMMDLPRRVKMMPARSKNFARNKATYDFHMFIHLDKNVLEFVPHLIPFSVLQEDAEHVPSASIIPCPRMYFDMRKLETNAMGTNRRQSRLSLDSFPATAMKYRENNALNKSKEQALSSYIIQRLKCKKTKKLEQALYFDETDIADSPYLTSKPEDLEGVPLQTGIISKHWEARAKQNHAGQPVKQPHTVHISDLKSEATEIEKALEIAQNIMKEPDTKNEKNETTDT